MPPEQQSIWLSRTPEMRRYASLAGDSEADVVVVGGGVAGIHTTYFLATAGKRVVLLESDHLGAGETGYTTAFLTSSIDTPFAALNERFGHGHIRTARAAGERGIALVEETQQREGISCGFTRLDALALSLREDDVPTMTREAEALRSLGAAVDVLDAHAAREFVSIAASALRIPGQAMFDVRQYLLALAERVQGRGGKIFEESRVTALETGDRVTVRTAGGSVRAEHAVLATGLFPPPYRGQNKLFRQMATYVIALARVAGAPPWRLPRALVWDAVEPFHYLRFLDDTLILGGEDRPLREAGTVGDAPWEALAAFVPTFEPDAETEVTHRWQGQILETPDALPVVGAPPEGDPRVLLASGFGGNGMTLGTVAARTAADLITGTLTPTDNPFRFERETLRISSPR